MKGVRCSWVDLQKIRRLLANGTRGEQTALEMMRCVDHSTVSTWKAAADVADAIEGKCSISNVSHFQPSHAAEIARAFRKREPVWTDETKEEIADWVGRVEAEEWTVKDLRQALLEDGAKPSRTEDGCTVDDLQKLADSGEVFGTIYADPPWQYSNQATRASTDKNYPTMTLDDICSLPVTALADDPCHLHLWTTNAFLFEAPRILAAWGFEYKSMFVWCKPQMGIGNYWRVSHEFLVLGVRGRSQTFKDKGLMSWAEIERGAHSAKPEQVRLWIERASPGPFLELFGREAVKGWTVWGNQVSRNIFTEGMAAK